MQYVVKCYPAVKKIVHVSVV